MKYAKLGLNWKNDSLINARAVGKKNNYRLIYNIEGKSANATLEIYTNGKLSARMFGSDFDFLKKCANEIESWQ
jgi:hypothetical protein